MFNSRYNLFYQLSTTHPKFNNQEELLRQLVVEVVAVHLDQAKEDSGGEVMQIMSKINQEYLQMIFANSLGFNVMQLIILQKSLKYMHLLV